MMFKRPLRQQPTGEGLDESGDIDRLRESERGIHHPYFDGAKTGAGANIPVQILHTVDHAGIAEAPE